MNILWWYIIDIGNYNYHVANIVHKYLIQHIKPLLSKGDKRRIYNKYNIDIDININIDIILFV